jgi:hypothetical protein
MDRALINEFREKVNDQDIVLKKYHNRNGKDLWNIICSAMDWIDVVVDSIDITNLSRKNDNESSIKVMTFITCIDLLWEAIQQLHRVFFHTNKIPFANDSSTFKIKLFSATDNDYFKTLRACFAAHPINLNDRFGGDGKDERRYASWSGGGFGEGDFSVILNSSQPDKNFLFLDIYFDELLTFAKLRYNYLRTIMKKIDTQVEHYFDSWRKQNITRGTSPTEQIDILINENKQRLDNDHYNYELEKLRIIFNASINNSKNLKLVDHYRTTLSDKIEEIFTNLQQMIISEIQSLDDSCPSNCQYAFSKLSDAVYGAGYHAYIDKHEYESSIGTVVLSIADGNLM